MNRRREHRSSLIFSRAAFVLLLASAPASAHSPLFNLFGSYFPGWMLCVLASIMLVVLLRLLILKLKLDEYIAPAGLTYAALTLFFSFTLWLVLFD